MDYNKFTQEQLIEFCKGRGLSYSSDLSKEELISILIEYDNNHNKNLNTNSVPSNINVQNYQSTAANWNIGFAIFLIVIGAILSLILIGIPLLVFGILSLNAQNRYKREPNEYNTWKAAIYGTWFGPISITGAMILRTDNRFPQEEMDSFMKFSWNMFWTRLALSIIGMFIWFLGFIFVIVDLVLLIIVIVQTYKFKSRLVPQQEFTNKLD